MNAGSYGKANLSYSFARSKDNQNMMITAGGFRTDGKRSNSDKDAGLFSFYWQKKDERQTQYYLNLRYYHSYHGCPGPTDNETPDARQSYEKRAVDLKVDGLMGDIGEFSIKSYADIVDLKDRLQTGNKSTLDVYKTGIKADTIWSHEEDGTWETRLGAMFEYNKVNHNITGDHHREKVSLHGQVDKEIGDVTASFGLRGDYVSDFELFPAVSVGLCYAIREQSLLKGNFGYSVDVPTFG